ncbi:aspartyl protease family protein [Pseudozobellia thermophila]|uniref:Aspartyl protease n=1 Tax=Pseudozobellia thermophila TaxID=192903 RepID=A0A1M6JWW2_9FLAO|nr:PDZ domain-containing protein [Pseudozobellia thermophila]SHJ51170.1 Aspartyl protease [Pseudozobellia thermophila]
MDRKIHHIVILFVLVPFLCAAQGFAIKGGRKVQKLKFELINNLMVVPVEVNGTELYFLLDSGVGSPILFNISDKDSLQINNVSEITIRGLGKGQPIKALSSAGNTFRIRNIENTEQKLFVVMDKSINLSPSLGVPIHGIMGYDLFRDFVVEVNYARKKIIFHDPESYRYRVGARAETLPLAIRNKKAYVDGGLNLDGKEELPVRLLVDTGSSDALWLFEDDRIKVPDSHYEVFLGKGLNGDIYGKRTKVSGFKIGGFAFEEAKAAFPDRESFGFIRNFGSRNGSIGGEVLKRFNVIFDYGRHKITLQKNLNFNKPFHYNLSGLNLRHNGMRYIAESIADSRGVVNDPKKSFGNVQLMFENRTRLSLVPEIVISGIRAGSPAHEAGLREGDIILAVNGKKVHRYKLQEVIQMLNEKEGKRIKLRVGRYNSDLLFTFVLKSMLK